MGDDEFAAGGASLLPGQPPKFLGVEIIFKYPLNFSDCYAKTIGAFRATG
jgi:hypothetical protein